MIRFFCHLKVRVLWKLFLQVPEPARVKQSENDALEEVSDEEGHEREDSVHDGEFHQLLAEHGLPAELPQVQLLFQVVDVAVGGGGAVLARGLDLSGADIAKETTAGN